jgi:hypothetical protein
MVMEQPMKGLRTTLLANRTHTSYTWEIYEVFQNGLSAETLPIELKRREK